MNATQWLDLAVEQIHADPGAGAQGPPFPQVYVSSSAQALSQGLSDALALDVAVTDSGGGTYIAACVGLKPSGGFSVAIRSARRSEDHVAVRLSIQEPGRDGFSIQVITAPFAVALIRDVDPGGRTFSFEADLNWEIVEVRS
jgi:hypothetical protein